MISSVSRLIFSIRQSFSMLGHAQSSPKVRGATVWYALTKRVRRWRSKRASLWRMNSSAMACTRAMPARSRTASLGRSR